jgi:hypothetical protein
VNKDQVPEIATLAIKRDEENSIEKRKDVKYRKVWKIAERKEGQVNKERVQEIVLSGIVVKDESTDRKKEVREIMNLPMNMMMNLPMKMMMNTHQSMNCSEPFGLETPK